MNIHRKILILDLVTLVPTIFLLVYLNINRLQESRLIQIQNLHNVVQLVSAENTQVVENVKHLLTTISVIPEVQYPTNNCDNLLAGIITKYQRYGNFGITDLEGNVICSAVPTTETINLSDRFFFQETKKNNKFSTGEYVVSRSTGKASINFGYPRRDQNGVVYATLNLDWLNNLTANLDIDKDLIVLVLDKNGVVLARYPDPDKWIGKEFPNDPIIKALDSNEGIIEASGLDNINRLYAFESLNKNVGPYILVGQTKSAIFSDPSSKFLKFSIITIVIIITSLFSGLVVGKSLIENTVQKLKEVDELRKDFISLISHQIRTPATSIKWFIEILLSESSGKLNNKQKSLLKDAHISTKRLVELIGTVLSITRLENNKINLQIKPADIKKMISEIVKSVQKEFKYKKIKAITDISKNTPDLINIDDKLFYQAIFNLIHNAIKYSYQGGIVNIKLKKVNNVLIIKIADYGIGIPKKEIGDMFVKFFRASNANQSDTKGAGLGLYLSRLIVKAHNGGIRIDSKNNKTLVLVTIPLI